MNTRLENIASTVITRMGLVAVKSGADAVPGKTATFTVRGGTIRIERHAKMSPAMIDTLREVAACKHFGLGGFVGLNLYATLTAAEKAAVNITYFRSEVSEITP